MAQQVTNLTRIHEDVGLIPASLSGLRIDVAIGCGIGLRHSSDLTLLWLWPTAVAPVQPLAQELPYTALPKKSVSIKW